MSDKKKKQKRETMSAVASSIDFIKSQIASDLLTANNKNIIDLNSEELRKITSIVQNSITSSFIKSSGQIESSL